MPVPRAAGLVAAEGVPLGGDAGEAGRRQWHRVQVPGVDVPGVIQVHRRYLVELMQQWTRLKEDEADQDLAFGLVVDAELFRLDSVVRWLDAADGRLKRFSSGPPVHATNALPRMRRKAGVRR